MVQTLRSRAEVILANRLEGHPEIIAISEDAELMEPLRAMRDAGVRVSVVGSDSKKSHKGKRGSAEVTVDTTADKVETSRFDAIIIPGGYAPDKMRLHQPMVDLIWKAYAKGKIIAAVCHGPQLLISADIVKGHRVTSWPSVPVDLKNAGSTWVDEPVIRDGNIITRHLGRGFTCAGR